MIARTDSASLHLIFACAHIFENSENSPHFGAFDFFEAGM